MFRKNTISLPFQDLIRHNALGGPLQDVFLIGAVQLVFVRDCRHKVQQFHVQEGMPPFHRVGEELSDLVSRSPAKAVLTGQGSDEFFCGYVGYMVDLFRNMQKGRMTPEELALNAELSSPPEI